MSTTFNSTQRTRRQLERTTPNIVFEINLVDDAEAERLSLQQAAIRDVMLWHQQDRNSASSDSNIT
jgi:hypothetical protein